MRGLIPENVSIGFRWIRRLRRARYGIAITSPNQSFDLNRRTLAVKVHLRRWRVTDNRSNRTRLGNGCLECQGHLIDLCICESSEREQRGGGKNINLIHLLSPFFVCVKLNYRRQSSVAVAYTPAFLIESESSSPPRYPENVAV